MSKETKTRENLEILSFSGGSFLTEFLSTVFGSWIFFFYETEIGLDGWLITMGYTIYAFWNAFNSPLLGYYTNRNYKFNQRWGKHFPWIFISSFPWFITLLFIYSPTLINPQLSELAVFIWFIIFLCLFSFFFTIFGVNYASLFPKKFRNDTERRKASAIIGAVSFIASGFGSVFPSLIIIFDKALSYSFMAFYCVLIASIIMIFSIPGIREKRIINHHRDIPEDSNNKLRFFQFLKFGIKQRNFMILVLVYFFNLIILQSVGAAFPYAVKYIFQKPAIYIALISLCYIGGAVFSMPVWNKIGDFLNNNRKLFMINCILLIMAQLFLFLVPNLTASYFAGFLYGFFIAGFWTILSFPMNADVLDELAFLTKQRNEAMFMGIRGFFVNFSVVARSAIFAIFHEATGFTEDSNTQSLLAQWGIRITLALAPLICTVIILILIWKFYDLTPLKLKSIKKELNELNL